MRLLAIILSMLFLLSVNFPALTKTNPSLPYGEWNYVFIYPNVLFSQITYVRFLDTNGYLNENPLPDLTTSDKNSLSVWRKDIYRNFAIANKGSLPPQWIQFCWDSLVDKKIYQTTIEFPPKVWTMMRKEIPTQSGPFYHDNMIFGLAPGGKVRVWFNSPGEQGGENIQIAEATSVSGKDLTLCQGKMAFRDGYPDSAKIKAFIKGKAYPYGDW